MDKANVTIDFDKTNEKYIKNAAELLANSFPQAYQDSARAEMDEILGEERIAVMAVFDDMLVGFTGAIPQYGVTGWELHPLIVKPDFRGQELARAWLKNLRKRWRRAAGS